MQRISSQHAADGSLDPAANLSTLGLIKSNYVRPSDTIFPQVLRGVVRNCVDSMVLNPADQVLMGLRVNEPWHARWHPSGGAQANGDSYAETSALHLKRDFVLEVHPARFEYVNSASFPWSTSAAGVPCHLNGVLMAVRLTNEELARRIVPERGDFDETAFFPLAGITPENGFHPAIALGARIILHNLRHHRRLGTINPDLL